MKTVHLLVSSLFLAGCSTAQSIQHEPPSSGATRVYQGDFPAVADATSAAMKDVGLEITSSVDQANGDRVIVGTHGVSGGGSGELVRALIERLPNGKTAVRLLTERKFNGDVPRIFYDEDIFTLIGIKTGEWR